MFDVVCACGLIVPWQSYRVKRGPRTRRARHTSPLCPLCLLRRLLPYQSLCIFDRFLQLLSPTVSSASLLAPCASLVKCTPNPGPLHTPAVSPRPLEHPTPHAACYNSPTQPYPFHQCYPAQNCYTHVVPPQHRKSLTYFLHCSKSHTLKGC